MYRNSFRLTNREIDEAFAGGHFRLVYQPRIELASGAMTGVEAFARWHHPEFGLIPPPLFLPVLGRQGRTQELTRFVLREAVTQLAGWRQDKRDWCISVNVAPEELADGSLAASIRLALNAADLPADALVIDLPERGLAEEPERAEATVRALSEIGVGMALECMPQPMLDLDTFGAPAFGELKIGGSAIINFATRIEGTGLGLMQRRLAYARKHGLTATAVGAETAEAIGALRTLGFTAIQGNAIAAPMAAHMLDRFDAAEALAATAEKGAAKDDAASGEPLKEFNGPPDAAPRKSPRIRVVRGKAAVALVDGGEAGRRVIRLTAPKHEDGPERAGGFLARLQRSVTRSILG